MTNVHETLRHRPGDSDRAEPTSHRRVFLGAATRKALYVAPAVMMLKAPARLNGAGPSCGNAGSPCAADAECCGGFFCRTPAMNPCAGEPDCTCQ